MVFNLNDDAKIDEERLQIAELIEILDKKEKKDEEDLKTAKLSLKQAMMLHDEAASIIRALLDLKDILKKKDHGTLAEYSPEDLIKQKVDQAKKWNNFMDENQTARGHPTLKGWGMLRAARFG